MQTRNLPSLCHTEAGRNDEGCIAILRKALQGSAESNSGAAYDRFTTTVDAFEGSKVECVEEVVAFLEVTSKLGEQEVGCERNFD